MIRLAKILGGSGSSTQRLTNFCPEATGTGHRWEYKTFPLNGNSALKMVPVSDSVR
jgi:hypothetical protein